MGNYAFRLCEVSVKTMWSERQGIAIDLGSSHSSVYVLGEGLIPTRIVPAGETETDEHYVVPSLVSVQGLGEELKCLAAGDDAWDMMGRRVEEHIRLVRPIEDGACKNQDAASFLMKTMSGFSGSKKWNSPLVVVGVPHNTTPAERYALKEAIKKAFPGSDPRLVSEAFAAAYGSEIDIDGPISKMFTDWGAATIDMAVLSKGEMAARPASITCGGGQLLNDIIIRNVRQEHSVDIGPLTAEYIKKNLVVAGGDTSKLQKKEVVVKGRSRGEKKELKLTAEGIAPWFTETWANIAENMVEYVEELSPQIHTDLQELDNPVLMSGGGSGINELAALLEKVTGLKFQRVKRPQVAVILGLGVMLEDKKRLCIGEQALQFERQLQRMPHGNGRSRTSNTSA